MNRMQEGLGAKHQHFPFLFELLNVSRKLAHIQGVQRNWQHIHMKIYSNIYLNLYYLK